MKKSIVAVVIGVVAVVAAAIHLTNDSADPTAPPTAASPNQNTDGALVAPSVSASAASSPRPAQTPLAPQDPRLATLAVSPPNDLIEFIRTPEGQVIKEIDKDPASLSFNQPSREYMYSQGKVTGLTAYRYLGDQVEITQTAVSYKADGSVDELLEKTTYRDQKSKP